MKDNNMHKNYRNGGFTLLELALVIVIIGVMGSLIITAYLSHIERTKIKTTKYRMQEVSESLETYLRLNGRYPCAAARNLEQENTNFGREVTTDCDSAAGGVPATVRVSMGGDFIRIGSLPTRALSLPDEYAVDGWGRRFTYAITERMATRDRYAADGGLISVVDVNGTEFVEYDHDNNTATPEIPAAQYVIVSHGDSGVGSFTINGQRSLNCSGITRDRENCDDDGVFVSADVNNLAEVANAYDDYVYYKGQTEPVFTIEQDAVMAFNLQSCPDGWSEHTPAHARFIIGGGGPNGSEVRRNLAAITSTPAFDTELYFTAGSSTSEQDDESFFPPYIALLHCIKQ